MARGFLSGAFWGSAVSICALGVVSTLAPGPDLAAVPVAPQETVEPVQKPDPEPVEVAPAPSVVAEDTAPPETKEIPEVAEVTPAPEPQDTTPPPRENTIVLPQQAPKAPAPQPDTLAALPQDATAPPALPVTGAAPDLVDPDLETAASDIEATRSETPVVPGAQATGLQAPGETPSISVSTDPGQAPVSPADPEIALTVDPAQPAPPSGEETAFGAPAAVEPPEPGVTTSISVEPDQPQAPAVPLETQAFEPPIPDGGAEAVSPSAPNPAMPDSDAVDETSTAIPAPENQAVLEPPVDQEPEPNAEEAAPESDPVPNLSGPVGVIGNLAQGVETNRLPSLADRASSASNDADQSDASKGAERQPSRPVEEFAAAFENNGEKPVMAIILMDEGVDLSRTTIGLPALRSFPYPISFAVDATLPDAMARMAAYRREGFEVLALVDLPAGADARDAEVTLGVALAALPEAVGVLEGVGEGLQGSRDAAAQVTEILSQTGHGFVTQNNGLNTVQKLAVKSGVPAAAVFRDFDSAAQTPTAIRRVLDQAAFKAAREGDVIMLGRLREDTISALLIWGLQDRAKTVALAPVSAALQTQ